MHAVAGLPPENMGGKVPIKGQLNGLWPINKTTLLREIQTESGVATTLLASIFALDAQLKSIVGSDITGSTGALLESCGN